MEVFKNYNKWRVNHKNDSQERKLKTIPTNMFKIKFDSYNYQILFDHMILKRTLMDYFVHVSQT